MNISKDQMANARVLVVGDVMLDRYWYGAHTLCYILGNKQL